VPGAFTLTHLLTAREAAAVVRLPSFFTHLTLCLPGERRLSDKRLGLRRSLADQGVGGWVLQLAAATAVGLTPDEPATGSKSVLAHALVRPIEIPTGF
jgi:hypothetical protein